GVARSEPHELIGDASERIQLKGVFARTGFEELIETLLEINRRSTRHVIKVVTLSIPGQRWSHRDSVARMKKVVRTGKVLTPGKRGGRITKVGRVIIDKRAAKLPRRAARKGDAHRRHRLDGSGFHSQRSHSPLAQRVRERSARRRLRWNQLVP